MNIRHKNMQKNKRKNHQINNQHGVLLIEVLFAIVILSVGILGLVGLQAVSTRNSISAQDRTQAATLANEMVSQMYLRRSMTPNPTDLAAWQARVSNTALTGLQSASGTAGQVGGIVTVTVSWQAQDNKVGASTGNVQHQYVTQFAM